MPEVAAEITAIVPSSTALGNRLKRNRVHAKEQRDFAAKLPIKTKAGPPAFTQRSLSVIGILNRAAWKS
jgi:hypothetical protein